MRLYLMRHGLATKAARPADDFQRYLTPRGTEEVTAMAAALARRWGDRPLAVYYSPALRTRQTADLVREAVRNVQGQVPASGALYALSRPDWAPLAEHLRELAAAGKVADVVFVSHQPFLERWLADLAKVQLTFRQSAVAVLDYHEDAVRLAAYLTPAWQGDV